MNNIKIIAVIAALTTVFFAQESLAFDLYIQQIVNMQMWQFASATPASNQFLDTPPKSVTINFSAAVNPEESFIKVYDPYNNLIKTDNAFFNGNSMYVNLPLFNPGYAGTYRVEWQAFCQCNDTKMLNGSFYFNIR